MLRTALLTEDPLLWAGVSASVMTHAGCVIDLHTVSKTLPRRGGVLNCDLMIVDARERGYDWLRTTRLGASVPLLVVQQGSKFAAPPGRALKRQTTFIDTEKRKMIVAVKKFVREKRDFPQWSARWGNYVFHPEHCTVEITGRGAVQLSPHKFRFVLALFLHRCVRVHWSLLHRLAWGEKFEPRATIVAGHAEWAKEVLQLNGVNGYELVNYGTNYELRGLLRFDDEIDMSSESIQTLL